MDPGSKQEGRSALQRLSENPRLQAKVFVSFIPLRIGPISQSVTNFG